MKKYEQPSVEVVTLVADESLAFTISAGDNEVYDDEA